MTCENAIQYVNEHIQLAVAALKIGDWIVVSQDGILKDLIRSVYCYPAKKAAISEHSSCFCDSRRVPKVQRIAAGHYWYIVKDCDTGLDRDPVSIIRLTRDNSEYYRTLLKCQLEEYLNTVILPIFDNSLFDEVSREDAIQSMVRNDIYNEEDFRHIDKKEVS